MDDEDEDEDDDEEDEDEEEEGLLVEDRSWPTSPSFNVCQYLRNTKLVRSYHRINQSIDQTVSNREEGRKEKRVGS